jgi:lipid II isoglutaminyl synthase (glutamine-hydrolysing)
MNKTGKDTGMVLKICHLYPTLMSVAADRGNLFSIQKRCEWRGIKTEVEPVYVRQTPDFTAYDLILIHGAADREMELASKDIQFKASSLREAAQANVAFLCVCAGFQLMGHYYKPAQGDELKGVGILDLYTDGGGERFMTHMAMECKFQYKGQNVLVGYENHSGRTYLGQDIEPLGKVIVGWGNNGKDSGEGAMYKNIYASYLHGPLLPKNPWFTDYLIIRALERRYGPVELEPLDDTIENAAHQVALDLAMKFKGTMSAIEAASWKK